MGLSEESVQPFVIAPWPQVDVYTAHHDRDRCFEETVDGPFSVTVCGAWFPRTMLNRMHAFCAYVRCILIAMHIAWVAFRCSSTLVNLHV